MEGLYRCDRSAGGNVVDLVDVESFENEKNTENVEITENNENVNDAGKQVKLKKVQGRCQNMSYSSAILDYTWTPGQ